MILPNTFILDTFHLVAKFDPLHLFALPMGVINVTST